MKKMWKIGIILVIILVAGILGTMVGYMYIKPPPPPEIEKITQRELTENKEINRIYTTIKSAITSINMALCSILIYLYIDVYRKIHSEFTLGLIIAMVALLIYAITSNPFFHMLFGFRGIGMGPFLILPDLFAAVALCVLLSLSLK